MRYATFSLAFLCLSSLCAGVNAQIVVDQSQLSDTVYMANFSQTDLAQSFEQANDNITGASVKLRDGIGDGTAGDITIALYDNLPNAGGNLLGSGTETGVLAGQFAAVSFGQISLTPNSTYYLVFTSSNNTLGLGGDVNNPYSRGQVYANSGYGAFPDYDYTFQTFANTTAVPEPGSVALLVGMGLSGAGLLARRKNARKAA